MEKPSRSNHEAIDPPELPAVRTTLSGGPHESEWMGMGMGRVLGVLHLRFCKQKWRLNCQRLGSNSQKT